MEKKPTSRDRTSRNQASRVGHIVPQEFAAHIFEIEAAIGYHFDDASLLCQAFTRKSYCNEVNYAADPPFQSNEVLEFFGDSALSLSIVTHFLSTKTERYEHGVRSFLGEGSLTSIRSHLSDKSNLSASMRKLGLQKYLLMGAGDKKLGVENERSVMEDLFESILGAVYVDSGYSLPAVLSVVKRTLDFTADVAVDAQTAAVVVEQSPKNALQEYCVNLYSLEYRLLEETGRDHEKTYVCGCFVDGECLGRGSARKMKDAETIAAREALASLRAKDPDGTVKLEKTRKLHRK